MAIYVDLSRYSYAVETVPPGVIALNVGWLGGELGFPRGAVPEEFFENLILLARDHPSVRMRGFHACMLPHEEGRPPYPYRAEWGGVRIPLGSAEVRVYSSGGELLIAPDLVYHYVKDHGYFPPQKFIEAVLARRVSYDSR